MTVTINFADFWSHFDKQQNFFVDLLSKKFNVQVSDSPDFLIYSNYGDDHMKFDGIRIFYNGENHRISWHECDFAFSFDYLDDPRHFRLPNWFWYADPLLLLQHKPDPGQVLREKSGFCNMVISNGRSRKRIDFFHKLSKYRKVDSGGRYLNNIGGPVADKLAFVKKYKFTIAFENSSYPGYTTEKLFEPMLVNSIPVYWGNPLVSRDFNTAGFINFHDHGSDEAVIERIIKLDKNDDQFMAMMREPWYANNKLPDCMNEELILQQFDRIIASKGKIVPVSRSYKKYINSVRRSVVMFDSILNKYLHYRKPFR